MCRRDPGRDLRAPCSGLRGRSLISLRIGVPGAGSNGPSGVLDLATLAACPRSASGRSVLDVQLCRSCRDISDQGLRNEVAGMVNGKPRQILGGAGNDAVIVAPLRVRVG